MYDISELINSVKHLNQEELELLSSKILSIIGEGENATAQKAHTYAAPCCRKCGSSAVSKYGKDKNGKQRYKCKSCNTVFYKTSFSVVSKTRHSAYIWKGYVELLLKGAPLTECAKECGISVQTAFTWRHKILHALQADQSNRVLGGVVEIDDMFFPVSYKGNHTKSKNFVMPRESFKRGTDNNSTTGNMACVLCAYERQGQVYGQTTGIGSVTVNILDCAFKDRLMSDTIALTDKAYSYKNYFDTTSIKLIQLASHSVPKMQKSPPQILGSYHIQNVNNFHRRFRKHMRIYNGVATKYLNHYVNLFVWIENYKKAVESNLPNEMFKTLTKNESYVSYSDIVGMPPIPLIA